MTLIDDIHNNRQFNGLLKMLSKKMSFVRQYEDFKQSVLVEVYESKCNTIKEATTCAQRVAKRFYKERSNLLNSDGKAITQSYNDNVNYSPDDYEEPILSDEAYNAGGSLNYNAMLKDMHKEMCKEERMFCVKNYGNRDHYFVGSASRIPLNSLYAASERKVGIQ